MSRRSLVKTLIWIVYPYLTAVASRRSLFNRNGLVADQSLTYSLGVVADQSLTAMVLEIGATASRG